MSVTTQDNSIMWTGNYCEFVLYQQLRVGELLGFVCCVLFPSNTVAIHGAHNVPKVRNSNDNKRYWHLASILSSICSNQRENVSTGLVARRRKLSATLWRVITGLEQTHGETPKQSKHVFTGSLVNQKEIYGIPLSTYYCFGSVYTWWFSYHPARYPFIFCTFAGECSTLLTTVVPCHEGIF